MERMKASDFDQGLLNLFDRYVHGGINRREFMDGAAKYAVGGLTVTAIMEHLSPHYAWAQQVPGRVTRAATTRTPACDVRNRTADFTLIDD